LSRCAFGLRSTASDNKLDDRSEAHGLATNAAPRGPSPELHESHYHKDATTANPVADTVNDNQNHSIDGAKRAPSFAVDRTPSEWEKAFLLEQAKVMGGTQNPNQEEAFTADRTPSQWERAFEEERGTVMGAPARVESISKMSPEDLEKQFMAEMMATMGHDMFAAAEKGSNDPSPRHLSQTCEKRRAPSTVISRDRANPKRRIRGSIRVQTKNKRTLFFV
jgi:hypothetical protein